MRERKTNKNRVSFVAVIMALCALCSVLTGCNGTAGMGKEFEIPRQAMELMEFYVRYSTDDNRYAAEKAPLGFYYLEDFGYVPEYMEKPATEYVYGLHEVSKDKLLGVYQFLLADKIPQEEFMFAGEEIFHDAYEREDKYNVFMALMETKQVDKNTFTAVFNRYYDTILYDRISFTMVKEKVDEIPEGLEDKFSKGDNIWRIKDVWTIDAPRPDSVVQIGSVTEFIEFANAVKENPHGCMGITYKLTADLDFEGRVIEPVGYIQLDYDNKGTFFDEFENNFMGTFDGQGHTIKNLTVRYQRNSLRGGNHYPPAGLFAGLSRFGTIKNLNIENCTVEPADGLFLRIGTLVGECYGTVDNCHIINSSVHGESIVGGLAGEILNTGTVTNCTVDAVVKGQQGTGLLTGENRGTIENCTVKGKVTGYRNPLGDRYDLSPYRIGGFTGGSSGKIKDCYSDVSVEIQGYGQQTGAFSGTCENGEMLNCTYNKNKTTLKPVGYIRNASPDVRGK